MRSIRISSGRRIAIIDDDPVVIVAEQELLESEGHEVRSAETIQGGIELVREFEPELVLLDYVMPGGSGADVVRAIRQFNSLTQVILVSGVIGEEPVRQLLSELDIQGFHYKKDGNLRLLLHVDAVLKHAAVLNGLERQQHYLRRILEASPELSKLQPIPELFWTALNHVIRLVRGESHSTATIAALVVLEIDGRMAIQAASGDFETLIDLKRMAPEEAAILKGALGAAEPEAHEEGVVTIPFTTRSAERGCIMVRAAQLPPDAIEPCQLFTAQVVQALENVRLYERATVDPLTQVYNRDFGHKRLEEVLKLADRNQDSTGVILLDVDHFKALNDTHSHAAGDVALRAIARATKDACRTTDVVSRYGGEEFFVTLPTTALEGAMTIAERILQTIRGLTVEFEGKVLPVTASAGVAIAEAGETDVDEVLHRADLALYRSKADGRDRVTGPSERKPVSVPSVATG